MAVPPSREARPSASHLVGSLPDAVVGWSEDGTVTTWNGAAERVYGYREAEVVGQKVPSPAEPLLPADRPLRHLLAVLAHLGAADQDRAQLTRQDGAPIVVSVSASPVVDARGRVVGHMSVAHELTERERRQRQFEALVDSAPDAMVCVDSRGKITLVNSQAERMFGYNRGELVGQAVEVLVPLPVRHAHSGHRAAYMADAHPRPMGAGLALAARRKDGSEFPVDISLSALQTEGGTMVSAAVRDITERKRAEEERALLEAELQAAQRDEERALLESQLHQAQRLESVGQLAGGIAHDFNNLLAGIMNYASLVSDGLADLTARAGLGADDGARQLAQDVAEITKVAARAAQLTHQLLIFSRRELVNPQVLDLNSVVSDMEKLLRRTIGEAVDLGTKLEVGLPRTKVDRGQIEQVLMNLAVNARDAMPGGGRLAIETTSFEADEDFARQHGLSPGRYVRLNVSDTGTGMQPEVAARAFEPFFTTKARGDGTGLGLATVYGIVTQAGGQVVIYSEAGLGTTVKVLFPATNELQTGDQAPGRATPSARATETVLLVEDEEMVREPARRVLTRQGYAVLVASGPEQALSVAAAHDGTIQLLLTDVFMPGRSGKELAADLARARPGIKVLYMSGYSQDVIVHQGVLEEGVNLVEKPFATQVLLSKVREVLDG